MTQQEQNTIAAGLMVFATATEELIRTYMNMQQVQLAGESKMLFNSMQHAIRQAKFYYERLNDMFGQVLIESDKNANRFDLMREDADYLIRLYLRITNLNQLGYPNDEIENSLRRLQLKGMSEDNKQPDVSEAVIERFRLITKSIQDNDQTRSN